MFPATYSSLKPVAPLLKMALAPLRNEGDGKNGGVVAERFCIAVPITNYERNLGKVTAQCPKQPLKRSLHGPLMIWLVLSSKTDIRIE
jgi:hypothetical protein